MKPPAPTADETERLEALASLHILYSPAEARFDRITQLAQKIFDVPIALISLVTSDCQWFKSAQGLLAEQTPRTVSFCGHAIHQDQCFLVEDASTHPDFQDNPLVAGAPHIRFYAGQPVRYANRRIGTLCLIDRRPRKLEEIDLQTLRNLAEWVENELKVTAMSTPQTLLLAELNNQGRRLLVDSASGCWNRRAAEILVPRELGACDPEARITAIEAYWMQDEELPESSGPVVPLKAIARALRDVIAAEDLIVQLGADRFLLLSLHLDSPGAQALVTRLEQRLRGVLRTCAADSTLGALILRGFSGPLERDLNLAQIESRCHAAEKAASADCGALYFRLQTPDRA